MTAERVRSERSTLLLQLPLLIWLVVLWILLWGHITVVSVLSGIVLALGITRVFYLPPVELSGRFNVYWAAVFVVRFLLDLVRASFLVAWQAIDPRGIPTSAVLLVQLHTRSDFIMTLTAEAISLVPGSIVVEVDREHSRLYVHSLGVKDDAEVEQARRIILAAEERLVRALGTLDDVWHINQERRMNGRPEIRLSAKQKRYEDERERHGERTGDTP
ncbi:Na+/H+ antiporter subunit E [Planctomonas psychrotolerans]|uniref:Na+/H+ antiporter subunit E n=1 Tax=Planctomonas psychrotolerans TaxID=2528712 RepID=UPI00123BD0BF|nr:Na+/H+ antiporter subunit E [Planctomonas psychrotolerans]